MAVFTITPETFGMVFYDTAQIRSVVEPLADQLGFGATESITLHINETTPLGRITMASADPVVLHIEGGAFEDPRRPRNFGPTQTVDSLGRALLRVIDRRSGGFADAPPDSELTFAQTAAWDAYVMGRIERLGHKAQKQRRIYNFRNRHGFSDVADNAFHALWNAESMTWAQLAALSEGATA